MHLVRGGCCYLRRNGQQTVLSRLTEGQPSQPEQAFSKVLDWRRLIEVTWKLDFETVCDGPCLSVVPQWKESSSCQIP
jgi:hypothetical protein